MLGALYQPLVAYLQFYFVAKESLRVALLLHQIVYEMLANPLFGCQSHVFTAQKVENHTLSVLLRDFYFVLW